MHRHVANGTGDERDGRMRAHGGFGGRQGRQ